jgi:hypothetical protein
MENGVEIFFLEPGAAQEMSCRVCDSKCTVRRNVYGPTGFVAAIGKKQKLHDVFTCPHAGEAWHDQARRLQHVIEAMPSKRVAELMRLDLEELLAEHRLAF